MFKISRLTDYALRIIVHLAKSSELQSAAAVAVATGISEPTVRKILKILNETTFINSTQGAAGGYRLAATLSDISLAMLINAMEGDIAITDCSQQTSCCVDAATCGFQAPWQYVNTKIQNLLNNISLAEMFKIKYDQEIKYYPKEELAV
jgi:FeS assembly SUF system regulator